MTPEAAAPRGAGDGPPLVLVVVGTDHHPFDRLVGWADAWAAAHPDVRVLVQRGTSSATSSAESVPLIDHAEVKRLMHEAAVVVCHGGPSTISECRRLGVLPLAVPRDPRFGEHVDGHQMRFVARLAEEGMLILVRDADELGARIDLALRDPSSIEVPASSDDPLVASNARFAQAVSTLFSR